MQKKAFFDLHFGRGWPEPKAVERYFIGPQKNPWLFETGADSAMISMEGLGGTEHLLPHQGRRDIHLSIWSHPMHGLLLMHQKLRGARDDEIYFSRGDTSRLREWVRSLHGDPLPVGLFIPHEWAWIAVKEFLENDGARSPGIEWIAARDLPPDTFPNRFRMPSS